MGRQVVPVAATRLDQSPEESTPQQLSSFLGSPSIDLAVSPPAAQSTVPLSRTVQSSSSASGASGIPGQASAPVVMHLEQHRTLNQATLHQTQNVLNLSAGPFIVQQASAEVAQARQETAQINAQASQALEHARQEVLETRGRAETLVSQAAHEVAEARSQAGEALRQKSLVLQQTASELQRVKAEADKRVIEVESVAAQQQRETLAQARLEFERMQVQMEQ